MTRVCWFLAGAVSAYLLLALSHQVGVWVVQARHPEGSDT